MKLPKFALLVLIVAGLSSAYAGVCPSTTLDQYLGAGYSCGINEQTYFDFSYASSSNPGGFAIPAGGVSVTPITTAGNQGFLFNAPWSASNNSGILAQDSLIQYTVNVNQGGTPITGLTLSMIGFGATGTGEVAINETYCIGAILPTCSGGTEGMLSLLWTSSGGTSSQTVNFAGATEVSVAEAILVTSGTNGQATVSGVYNLFSPEPGSFVLLGTGVLGIAGLLRRKLKI